MPITISIEDINPTGVFIDRIHQVVIMSYIDIDSNGNEVGNSREAYFWVEIPAEPDPAPENWFQLPVAYQTELFQMITDAVDAVKLRRGI